MKYTHLLFCGSVLTTLIATPAFAQAKPEELKDTKETQTQTTEQEAQLKKARIEEQSVLRQQEECKQQRQLPFLQDRDQRWLERRDTVEKAWTTYTKALQVAWDKYVAAKKSLDRVYDSAALSARNAKSQLNVETAKRNRETAHQAALRVLKADRQRAYDIWINARGAAIASWQKAFLSTSEQMRKAEDGCRAR